MFLSNSKPRKSLGDKTITKRASVSKYRLAHRVSTEECFPQFWFKFSSGITCENIELEGCRRFHSLIHFKPILGKNSSTCLVSVCVEKTFGIVAESISRFFCFYNSSSPSFVTIMSKNYSVNVFSNL